MKSFKEYLNEMGGGGGGGAGGAVGVGAVAGSGATSLPASQREPGVYLKKKKKAHNPVMMGMARRSPPKI